MLQYIPKELCNACVINIFCPSSNVEIEVKENVSVVLCGMEVSVIEADPVIAFTLDRNVDPEENFTISYAITPTRNLTTELLNSFLSMAPYIAPSFLIGDGTCSEGENNTDSQDCVRKEKPPKKGDIGFPKLPWKIIGYMVILFIITYGYMRLTTKKKPTPMKEEKIPITRKKKGKERKKRRRKK
jgi:hypothetical protein